MHPGHTFAATAALLGTLAQPGTLWAQAGNTAAMQPPAQGSVYSFTCTDQNGKAFNEEYKIVNANNDSVRVDVQTGSRRNSYQKPLHAMATTIVERETIDGQERTMSGSGSFAALRTLVPGTNVSTYLTERRGSSGRISWNYTVSILGREVVYHRDFGDLGVVVVNEDRWTELYSSSMQSHYAPQMNFPIYWKYKDSNQQLIECKLATATGVTPVAAVAARPAASTPPAAPAAPPPPRATAAPAPPPPPQVAAVPPSAAPAPPPPAAPPPVAAATPRPAPPPASSAAAPLDTGKQARLDQLNELLKQGVISKEEFAQKEREIRAESPASAIATELAEANRLFRDQRVTREEFIQRRARALGKITPGEMQPKDGLVLLNQLLDAQLISPSEHLAKRSLMLSAL